MTLFLFLMDVLVFDFVLGFVSVVLHSAEHFFEKIASTGDMDAGSRFPWQSHRQHWCL